MKRKISFADGWAFLHHSITRNLLSSDLRTTTSDSQGKHVVGTHPTGGSEMVTIKLGWKDKVNFNRYGKMGHNRLKALIEKSKEEKSGFPVERAANMPGD